MSDEERTWFEVQTRVKVLAADENDAINRVAGALREGYQMGAVYPVASFDARSCENPLRRRVEREIGPS